MLMITEMERLSPESLSSPTLTLQLQKVISKETQQMVT